MVRTNTSAASGQVLSLSPGANLQDALRACRALGATKGVPYPSLAAAPTARVNGRTVRRDYRIRNGDVLTLEKRGERTFSLI